MIFNSTGFTETKRICQYDTTIQFLQKEEIKVVRKSTTNNKFSTILLNEIAIYSLFRHYNMEQFTAKFLGMDLDARGIYIEAATMNLDDLTVSDDKQRMLRLSHVVKSTVLALQAVHSFGLIHCDPKPGNFLVFGSIQDMAPRIVICDFGYTSTVPIACYNDHYRAPEMWKDGARATVEADIWALGVTLLYYIWNDTVIKGHGTSNADETYCQEDFANLGDEVYEHMDDEILRPSCYYSEDEVDFSLEESEYDSENEYDHEFLKELHIQRDNIYTMCRFDPKERKLPIYPESSLFVQRRCNNLINDLVQRVDNSLVNGVKSLITKFTNNNDDQDFIQQELEILKHVNGLIYLPK
jgi:serine/threonine protein kinase